MQRRPIRAAAIAGALGALLLFAIQLALESTGAGGPPVGVAFASKMLSLNGPSSLMVGALLFCLAGAAWGALYGLLIPKVTPLSGVLFGLAPTLFALVVMLPLLSKPMFAGGDLKSILIPLALNSIWGALVGGLTPRLHRR